MLKNAQPQKPQKRIEKPWLLSVLSIPARNIAKSGNIPGIVAVVALIAFVFVALYYIWPRPKSFFLDVTTDYLEVTTDTDTQIVWDIGAAVLCLPERRLPDDHPARSASASDAGCDDRFVAQRITEVELDWPQDVTLVVRSGQNGTLDILTRFEEDRVLQIGDIPIMPETILRLPRSVLDWNGGLGLSGDLILGQTAEHGTLKLLREGRYETRERPFFRTNALLVDSGTFALGDAVALEARQEEDRLQSYAFLTLDLADPNGVAPMRVVATSPEERSRMRLDRARANPSFIEPNWSQRIANDPLAIGIATLLSLLATFLAVLNNLFRR